MRHYESIQMTGMRELANMKKTDTSAKLLPLNTPLFLYDHSLYIQI